jgi:hypothetical protein
MSNALWTTLVRLWIHSFLSCLFVYPELTYVSLKCYCGVLSANLTEMVLMSVSTLQENQTEEEQDVRQQQDFEEIGKSYAELESTYTKFLSDSGLSSVEYCRVGVHLLQEDIWKGIHQLQEYIWTESISFRRTNERKAAACNLLKWWLLQCWPFLCQKIGLIYSVQEVCSRTPKAEVQQFDIFFLVMAQSAKPY